LRQSKPTTLISRRSTTIALNSSVSAQAKIGFVAAVLHAAIALHAKLPDSDRRLHAKPGNTVEASVGEIGSDFDHLPVLNVLVWHEDDCGEITTTHEMSLGLAAA
jgi:hypothetical protein